jgi:hypothetical protein
MFEMGATFTQTRGEEKDSNIYLKGSKGITLITSTICNILMPFEEKCITATT